MVSELFSGRSAPAPNLSGTVGAAAGEAAAAAAGAAAFDVAVVAAADAVSAFATSGLVDAHSSAHPMALSSLQFVKTILSRLLKLVHLALAICSTAHGVL